MMQTFPRNARRDAMLASTDLLITNKSNNTGNEAKVKKKRQGPKSEGAQRYNSTLRWSDGGRTNNIVSYQVKKQNPRPLFITSRLD